MAEQKNQDVIKRIDNGLEEYYNSLNVLNYRNEHGDGKFKLFCDDNGFEQNDIREELAAGADDCMLVDFDSKDFPLTEELNDKKRNQEIFRIIDHCALYGSPPAPRTTFDFDIPLSELKQLEIEYKKQMPLLAKIGAKEPDLWYFLALGRHPKNKMSFLTNLVDLYTKDKTELFCKPQQKQTRLTVEDWCTNYNNFMMDLKRTSLTRAEKLKTAMISYSNRIMCRLQFTPTYKIIDSIQEISKYIVSIPLFIKHLIASEEAAVPFSVDLLIAVRNIKECTDVLGAEIDDKQNDIESEQENDDDDDDDDYTGYDPNKQTTEQKQHNIKHIGTMEDIQQTFDKANIKYSGPEFVDETLYEKLDKDERCLKKMYVKFCEQLAAKHSNYNDEKGHKEQKDKPFVNDDKKLNKKYKVNQHMPFRNQFYPQRKRFEIFVDRRDVQQPDELMYNGKDQILFFQPPNDCDTLPKNHVNEWFMEAARTCLIPSENYVDEQKDGYDAKKKLTITATDNLCGQLLTFSYHVNKQNEIKCYIIWNSQTMRFHGSYIQKVLPSIFAENVENNEFINGKNSKGRKVDEIEKQFDELMPDPDFEAFCAQYN